MRDHAARAAPQRERLPWRAGGSLKWPHAYRLDADQSRECSGPSRVWLPRILACPADKAGSIASVETSMPAFTEAPMTFRAGPLRLRPAPEDFLAYPAIDPFALFNKILAAWRPLGGIGDVRLVI